MDTRRSARLKLTVNDCGKQRLSRFVKRNLDLIEKIWIKKPNSLSRASRGSEKNSKSLEREGSDSYNAASKKPLKRLDTRRAAARLKQTINDCGKQRHSRFIKRDLELKEETWTKKPNYFSRASRDSKKNSKSLEREGSHSNRAASVQPLKTLDTRRTAERVKLTVNDCGKQRLSRFINRKLEVKEETKKPNALSRASRGSKMNARSLEIEGFNSNTAASVQPLKTLETRQTAARLKLTVNDCGKQRYSRFIKHNLELKEETKKPNFLSRASRGTKQKSLEGSNSNSAASVQPLKTLDTRRSARLKLTANDCGKQRLSRFIKRNLELVEKSWIKRPNSLSRASSGSKKNSNSLEREGSNSNITACVQPLRRNSKSATVDETRCTLEASMKVNFNDESRLSDPPITALSVDTIDPPNRCLRPINSTRQKPNKLRSNSNRQVDSREVSKATTTSTNSQDLTKWRPNHVNSPMTPCSSSEDDESSKSSDFPTTSSKVPSRTPSPNPSSESNHSLSTVRTISPSRSSDAASNCQHPMSLVPSPFVGSADLDPSAITSGSPLFETPNPSNGFPKKANSIISISDSDSQGESSLQEQEDASTSYQPFQRYSNRLDSPNAKFGSSECKSTDSQDRHYELSDDGQNSLPNASGMPLGISASPNTTTPQNSTSKHQTDSYSRKSSSGKENAGGQEEDIGLETLKKTLVELFAGEDAITTLPFIHRNWPEKCYKQPKKLPSPKKREQPDQQPSADFISLVEYNHNRYYVQCQLNDFEWETMNRVASRLRWIRDHELTHDTKFVFVKEESFHEVIDGVPENILKANASGGAVLLFDYVQECAAENELVKIRKQHVPKHKGTWRKMFGRYSLTPTFADFAFFITPEITDTGHHERDVALLKNLLQLSRGKLYSTLEELRKSPALHKVALRSTAISNSSDVMFVHFHWLYECVLDYKLHPLEYFACDFTVY